MAGKGLEAVKKLLLKLAMVYYWTWIISATIAIVVSVLYFAIICTIALTRQLIMAVKQIQSPIEWWQWGLMAGILSCPIFALAARHVENHRNDPK